MLQAERQQDDDPRGSYGLPLMDDAGEADSLVGRNEPALEPGFGGCGSFRSRNTSNQSTIRERLERLKQQAAAKFESLSRPSSSSYHSARSSEPAARPAPANAAVSFSEVQKSIAGLDTQVRSVIKRMAG